MSSLDRSTQEAILHYLDRDLAEKRLLSFVQLAWDEIMPESPFMNGWHVGCICEHLEALFHLQIQNLVLNCPPRCSKSILIAVLFCSWVWAKEPSSKFIYGSYNTDLAIRDSVETRDLIRSDWYQKKWSSLFAIAGWQVKPDSDMKSWFANDRGGYRIATSTTGARSTGHGADYLIAEDPNKAQDSNSKAMTDRAKRWWSRGMTSRFNNPKTLRKLISQQRVGQADLSGQILAEELGYECLTLPMRYEPARFLLPDSDPDKIRPTTVQRNKPEFADGPEGSGREAEGDLLWPERIGQQAVVQLEKELGPEASYQLQQRGGAVKGMIFKEEDFREFVGCLVNGEAGVRLKRGIGEDQSFAVSELRFFQTADTAQTAKKGSDWTAIPTLAITPNFDLLCVHMWRLKLEVPDQYSAIKYARAGICEFEPVSRTFHVMEPWDFEIMLQAVEAKGSGIGILQSAMVDGYPLQPLKAIGDKVQRAAALAIMVRNHKFYLPSGAPWGGMVRRELTTFPGGANDDMVDALAYGGILAREDEILRAGWSDMMTPSPAAKKAEENGHIAEFKDEEGEVFSVRF